MPRTNRYLESGAMYEICFRAKSSLPFVAYNCINYAIQCILARAQRDNKVILCHDIWNGSHPHIIVVSKDVYQLIKFQMEVKKKITDLMKALLGLEHLSIWEGDTSIIKIGDIEAAQDRIAYLYSNPAQDNLVESINHFPGASSWQEFNKCSERVDDEVVEIFPWIKLRSVTQLSGRQISKEEDLEVIKNFKLNKLWFKLKRSPNAWMKCFGRKSNSDAELINRQIYQRIQQREQIARDRRAKSKTSVVGSKKLKVQPILKPHQPKKREIKIFIFSLDKDIRLTQISRVRKIQSACRRCYRKWKEGQLSVKWPDGVFKPCLPPLANLLAS